MVREESLEIQKIEAIPLELLREPLDFIFAEHFRHRQMCRALEQLAASPNFRGRDIAAIDDFIRHDLALHVLDEEEDLFPLLRQRCEPEDEIGEVLGVLSAEHTQDEKDAAAVRGILGQAIEKSMPPAAIEGGIGALRRLAMQERRHLALENAVVMPIARIRLTAQDREVLARKFAARRGVALP